MSRHVTPVYHCPFCAEEDLRPVEEPYGAWACEACARVFTVSLVRVAEEQIPGRVAATPGAASPAASSPDGSSAGEGP